MRSYRYEREIYSIFQTGYMTYRTFYTNVKIHVNEIEFVYVSHNFYGNLRSMTL